MLPGRYRRNDESEGIDRFLFSSFFFLETRNDRHEAAISDVVLVDVERVGVASLYATLLGRDQGRADGDYLPRRMVLLGLARDAAGRDDGGVLEHVRGRQRGGGARGRAGYVHLGGPRVVVDAGVDRRLFRVRLAAHDHTETAAVALQAAQTADSAAQAGQFGVGRQGRQGGGPCQAQLGVRHLAGQLEEGNIGTRYTKTVVGWTVAVAGETDRCCKEKVIKSLARSE